MPKVMHFIKAWEEEHKKPIVDAEEVEMQLRWPPIDKMDASLSKMIKCRKLSLSTNMITNITGLSGMLNLVILSLGRNHLKSLSGVETVGATLEQLWVSYNAIEKLKPVKALTKLKVFYISNNNIRDWTELGYLQDLTDLNDLLACGNPIHENVDEDTWRHEITKRLPRLQKLDGIPCV